MVKGITEEALKDARDDIGNVRDEVIGALKTRDQKLEQLEKHLEKAAKVAAKAAAREEEEENEEEGGCDWWCDVAAEGVCLRPCAGVYEPDRYYCCGAEYSVCTNCYHSVLTEDQREQLELVDP